MVRTQRIIPPPISSAVTSAGTQMPRRFFSGLSRNGVHNTGGR